METLQNPELQLAQDFIRYTNRHVFLTGKAGTGKTTFLLNLKRSSPKRMVVVAPTGVAAINAGGVTIHSFFQLPFHPHVPAGENQSANTAPFKVSREKVNIIKSIDLLIIDEISMVRSDLLDAVDTILRRYRHQQVPFGGVQLLMIGDLQQLAPVVKDEDWEILGKFYDTAFFFGSHALQQTDYVTIELKHVYRQKDISFINLLNKIRDNRLDLASLQELNQRFDPGFEAEKHDGYITLTTHNAQAQSLNDVRLQKLAGKVKTFKADVKGDFPEFAWPNAMELQLKTGAQVMFVKNDISREKRYFNGKIGQIVDIDNHSIHVKFPAEDDTIEVERAEWQNMKYALDENTKEIKETVIGTFIQYPVKLAWAITIHKSQGLTFDKVIIDARAAFAHGQVYVALSRCRTLEGIVLSTPVSQHGIITDPAISGFVGDIEKNHPDHGVLVASRQSYQRMLLKELFSFESLYSQLNYIIRLVNEHSGSLVGISGESLQPIADIFRQDLVEISGRFIRQLNQMLMAADDAETDEHVAERISKACSFFAGKMEELVQTVIAGVKWETDNKEVRKQLADAFEKLMNDTTIKLSCLKSCTGGFNILHYLEARSKAAIEPVLKKPPRSTPDEAEIVPNEALFTLIRSWRNAKAQETGLPHYMIVQQKTMAELSAAMPGNMEALAMVKGMGKKRSEKYGEELLGIINRFCAEHGLESRVEAALPLKARPKSKEDTRLISFHMYRSGQSAAEIARQRSLAITTIEEHLAHFVGTGELSVNEFVDPELTRLIEENIDDDFDFRIGPLKSALGDQVSWSDLKFVIKHLEHSKKVKSEK